MTPFLFLSGWSGYPELFPALAPPLAAKGRFLVPFGPDGEEETVARLTALARDLGPAAASEASIAPEGTGPGSGAQAPRPMLLAWSTGAHLVLKHRAALFPLFSRLILAAPFRCFTDHVPAGKVKLMIRGLKRDPGAVLRDFHALCRARGDQPENPAPVALPRPGGIPASFAPDHVPALIQGLEFLLESRVPAPGLPFAGAKGPDIVLVRGDADAVVPAQACRDSAALLAAEGFLPRVLVGLHGHLPPETLLSALLHESPHPPLL